MSARGLAAVLSIAASSAWAHGDAGITPRKLSVRHGAPNEVWMDTDFGLVFGNVAGGGSWRWICEEAIGYFKNGGVYVSPAGRIFVAITEAPPGGARGLARSTDHCSWEMAPELLNVTTRDVQAVPSDPSVIYVPIGDGFGEGSLYRSTNGGDTFSKTSLAEDARLFTSVRVAPSDPQRVYAASWAFDPTVTVRLHRSEDGAAQFTTVDLTNALPKQGWFYVRAVHPTNPDVLFAEVQSTSSFNPSPVLLKSVDKGATFEPVLDAGGTGFQVAIDSTGTIVYAASDVGLYRSTNGGDSFEELPSPIWDACAVFTDAGFATCGSEWIDGFTLALIPDGGALQPMLHLDDIAGMPDCPVGTATRDVCGPLWEAVRASFKPPLDGGVPDAGVADGGTPPPPDGEACGCGSGGGTAALIALGLAAALLGRRRRNRAV